MKQIMKMVVGGGCLVALAWGVARAGEWAQWGGTHSRNMVSGERGLVETFEAGKQKEGSDEIDPATTKNVKWVAKIGSQSYGNPTVAGGKVYVGTNNEPPRDEKYEGDYGVVLCLDEATGKMVWQLAVPKLAAGNHSDFEGVGVCSSPTVVGNRVYVVTNRCEVVCLDVEGLANGNDGPFKEEGQYVSGPGREPIEVGATDADIIWRYDMRDELGVFPLNMASSSVLVVGERVYATTSNSVNWTHKHIPAPNAPALICLDRNTGKLLGEERSGISRRTFTSNWSSPSYGEVNGKGLVFFGGGDGVCYAFGAEPVEGVLKEVWRFDCNAGAKRDEEGHPTEYNRPGGPSEIIGTPVFHGDRVYVAIGQNPENGEGDGGMFCIDATKTGNITEAGRVWKYEKINRSLSTASVVGDLVFVADIAGFLHCLDAKTGAAHWTHDLEGKAWGSTMVADGKVYVGNDMGDLWILSAGKEKKEVGRVAMNSPMFSTPVVAGGRVYLQTEKYLYVVGK